MRSMVMVVVVAMVLWTAAGCQDDEHFPPGEGGGGGGGGGSGQIDGGSDDAGPADAAEGDAGAQLAGELCDVVDLRRPLFCADNDLSGIEVSAVGEDATDQTNAEGRFSLDVEPAANLQLVVSSRADTTRLALVRVDMWAEGGLRVPRVDKDLWDQLIEASIGTNEPTGTASIALYVVSSLDGLPVPDVVVEVVDSGGALVYYDGGSPDEWIMLGDTGALGAALIVQVPVADSAVVVMVDTQPVEIPVEPDHLTWARVEV